MRERCHLRCARHFEKRRLRARVVTGAISGDADVEVDRRAVEAGGECALECVEGCVVVLGVEGRTALGEKLGGVVGGEGAAKRKQ